MKILQNTALILAADSKNLPSMLAAVLSAMMPYSVIVQSYSREHHINFLTVFICTAQNNV